MEQLLLRLLIDH